MLFFVKERAQRRLKDIESAIYRVRTPLGNLRFFQGEVPGGEAPDLDDSAWSEVEVGHSWTGADESSWLRGAFTVPAEWAGERVGLWIHIDNAEPLLYLDGKPAQALDYNHQDVLLYDPAQGGESHAFAIDSWAHSRGGTFTLKAADLVAIDREAYALYFDFSVVFQMLDMLPETTPAYQGALRALDGAMNALDYTQGAGSDAFYASLPAAREILRRDFYEAFPADPRTDPAMLLVGQSHVDVAWRWTLANTRKKMGRTVSTALRLMDEYPDYTFTFSQPQLYQYLKENYPDLYEQVKARVAEGRWELTGGAWIEPDCNLASGESLIRQFLFGNRFFKKEFGRTTHILWQPDVFGYTGALPQIIKGCGLDYFMTTKLGWNQFNKIPYDTFDWQGIDGTRVLTHFHPGLNHMMSAREIRDNWNGYKQKSINSEVFDLYGYGDGGGGATRAMLESGKRFSDIAGFPRCSFGLAEPYFERLAERVGNHPDLPRWVGELYLEYHRGTLTSQGRIKRANRKSEILYRNAEIFSVLARVETGAEYPQENLNAGWEKILLNQFHDILPGTSLNQVYRDADRDYAEITKRGEESLNAALDAIAARIDVRRDSVAVFNPTDTLRPGDAARIRVPSRLGDVEFSDTDGAPLPAQPVEAAEGDSPEEAAYLVAIPEVGPLGYFTLAVGKAGGPPEASTVRASDRMLENEFVRVRFDDAGEIVSLVHKLVDEDDPDEVTEREVIVPGQPGNALVVYEDKPMNYDAWDIDIFYLSKPYPVREVGTVESIRVIEEGPVRAGLEIRRRFLRSSMVQRVYLYSHSPRLDFETEVDWQERQMLLKAGFPVQVNAPAATYEIQFGAVERPTHWNTSWDWARFEVCGHKWADLSEGDYGVSLLNDCKYGYDIRDNVLRLTLLKGGIDPDPEADLGRHVFTYSLLPHTGTWRAETVDEAYALNYPLMSRFVAAGGGGDLPASYELATVDDQGIIIETIKKAEDGDDIVVRVFEAMNTRGTATLTLGFEIAEAYTVNMVEENPEPIAHGRNTVTFDYRPFEIKTLLLKPRP